MHTINIAEREDTPRILLDAAKGQFEISKKCFPEDAIAFYAPIIEWLNKYSKTPNPATVFSFRMDYFNTATSKQIYKILYEGSTPQKALQALMSRDLKEEW